MLTLMFKFSTHRFISRYESPNLLLRGAGVFAFSFSSRIALNFSELFAIRDSVGRSAV